MFFCYLLLQADHSGQLSVMAVILNKENETSILLQTRPRVAVCQDPEEKMKDRSSGWCGRPRKYGHQDFRSVRSILDKQIRLKANVFTQWNIVKNMNTETRTMSHSDFASILLNYYQKAEEEKVGIGSTIMRKQCVPI